MKAQQLAAANMALVGAYLDDGDDGDVAEDFPGLTCAYDFM